MKRAAPLILAAMLILVILAMGGSPATADLSPQQQITNLKKQLRQIRLDNADLKDQVDAQNAEIEDQDDTIQRLRTRLASQSDPLDAITTRGPDGLWAAMLAIWRVFPTIPEGQLCGYDHSSVPGDGVGLTITTYTFERWTGC